MSFLHYAIPPGLRPAARNAVQAVRRLLGTPEGQRDAWVRGYTAFQMREREDLFKSIAYFCHVNRPMTGYYLEFGCHNGNTMRMAWRNSRYLFDWDFIAFDSFEGFPEISGIDQQEIWAPGKCATAEEDFRRIVRSAGMPAKKLTTVKGFYDRSLTPELAARLQPKKAVVCYIDCDLYHSTVPVLDFIREFLQVGTIIVFDDWNCYWGDPERGERKAWTEFLERHPKLNFEPFVSKTMAHAFIYTGERA